MCGVDIGKAKCPPYANGVFYSNIQISREIFKFRDFMNTLRNFAKSVFAHIFGNLNISRK